MTKQHLLPPHFFRILLTITLPIAAVGLGNQIFFLLNMVLFGISSGAAIFVAQHWGKKDIPGIR